MPSELLVEYGPTPAIEESEPTQEQRAFREMSRLLRTVDAVKAWMPTVEDRLVKAYLAPQHEGLRLFAIGRVRGDFKPLDDALEALSDALGDAGVYLRTMVLLDGTPDEFAAFFDPNAALLLSWKEPCPTRPNTGTSTPSTARF